MARGGNKSFNLKYTSVHMSRIQKKEWTDNQCTKIKSNEKKKIVWESYFLVPYFL